MVADKLDVRTAQILCEVFVVHKVVGGRLLQNGREQDRTLIVDAIELGDIVNIVAKLLDGIGRQALAVDFSVDTVQAGRLVLYGLILGEETLLGKHVWFSGLSHIGSFFIHTS